MKVTDPRLPRPSAPFRSTAARPNEAKAAPRRPSTPKDRFESGPARPKTPAGPPAQPLPPTPIETLYTDPLHHDSMGDRFVQLLDTEAKKTVDGAFYEIADERIVAAFIRAAQRGVQVRLVTDDNYFQNEDTQKSLEHTVNSLSLVHEFMKDMRAVKTSRPDYPDKAAILLEQLPVLEQATQDANLPEHLAVDFLPVRLYLEALSKKDASAIAGTQYKAYSVAGSVSSDLGGEKVRLLFRPHYDKMIEAGVQFRDDDSSLLSHNKYMVLDQKKVWVGSYNLQGLKSDDGGTAGLYKTADNAVVLSSPTIASSFLADFKQMFEEGRFHDNKSEINGRSLRVNGVKVTPFFAPKDTALANLAADLGTLLNRMRAANEAGRPLSPPPRIRLAGFAMSYTGTEAIVDMLALLHREGADVQVVADALSAGSSTSSVKALRARGVPVMVTTPGVMMHHKFLSVEAGRTNFVYTGSANFTHPAHFDNDESVLRLESQKMSEAYRAIFDSLRDDVRDESPIPEPTPGAIELPSEELWTTVDPDQVRSLSDAQKYARLRWGW